MHLRWRYLFTRGAGLWPTKNLPLLSLVCALRVCFHLQSLALRDEIWAQKNRKRIKKKVPKRHWCSIHSRIVLRCMREANENTRIEMQHNTCIYSKCTSISWLFISRKEGDVQFYARNYLFSMAMVLNTFAANSTNHESERRVIWTHCKICKMIYYFVYLKYFCNVFYEPHFSLCICYISKVYFQI